MASSRRSMLVGATVLMLILTGMSGCTPNLSPCRKLLLGAKSFPVAAIIPTSFSEAYVVRTDGLVDDYRTRTAVIDKVSTTLGEETLEHSIELHGEYRCHAITEESIYMAVESYVAPLSYTNSTTSIYRISLKDDDTTRLCSFNGVLFKGMWFSNDGQRASVLLRRSAKENDLLWMTSSNGGVTWNDLPMNQRIDIMHLADTVLYSSTSDPQRKRSVLTEQRADGSIVRSSGIPMTIAAFCSPVENNQEILCLGSDDNGILVQSVDGNSIDLIHRFGVSKDYFAKDIYRFGSFIAVTLGRMDSQMFAGHGGIGYEMYVSTDSGESWLRINSGDEMYLAPTGFYQSEWIMNPLATGHLLLCSIPR